MEYGEIVVSPYAMVQIANNATSIITKIDGLPAGVYSFAGNWGLKADPGVTITTHHCDIGVNAASIDTAPAGGSTYGSHIQIPGDPNLVTFCKLVGRRILTLNGMQSAYLRTISSWSPSSAIVKAYGCLNWHKLADLPPS